MVESVHNELRVAIQLLERAIGAVDAPRLNRRGDPWIYFYEQFLGAYDPALRNSRGVYYTPVPVVEAQTRLAAELLLTRFGKPLAFAERQRARPGDGHRNVSLDRARPRGR